MILHQNFLFPKNKNTAEPDNLDDSEVISSDFFGYEIFAATLAPSVVML